MNIFRSGDILLKEVKKPKNLKFVGKKTSFVLAIGETTGHKHLLTAEPTTVFDVFQDEKGNYYLEMENKGMLTHEEHKEITIERGFYIIGHEQEYNYFENEAVRVQD